jgi:putative aminopeptidase FrvX
MNLDQNMLKGILEDILNIPSPTGYTKDITKYIKNLLERYQVKFTETNKGAVSAVISGESIEEKTLTAHIDTLGAMATEIKSNGRLSITPIGGYMMNTIEGENCIVYTLSDKKYSGTVQTLKPSVHISGEESYNLKRSPENMELILDEKVFSKEDVSALGINVGDFISFDTKTRITENGFVKSRYLDDKASAAILLYTIIYIKENKINLPYTTNFFFSNMEEIGLGGSSNISPRTKEFIAVDMGAPGPNQNSTEYAVSICAKDSSGPFNLELRKKLVDIAEKEGIDYRVDIYPHYASDVLAALRAGYDIKAALIGPGVFASHAYERTHMDSIINTLKLLIEYLKQK